MERGVSVVHTVYFACVRICRLTHGKRAVEIRESAHIGIAVELEHNPLGGWFRWCKTLDRNVSDRGLFIYPPLGGGERRRGFVLGRVVECVHLRLDVRLFRFVCEDDAAHFGDSGCCAKSTVRKDGKPKDKGSTTNIFLPCVHGICFPPVANASSAQVRSASSMSSSCSFSVCPSEVI